MSFYILEPRKNGGEMNPDLISQPFLAVFGSRISRAYKKPPQQTQIVFTLWRHKDSIQTLTASSDGK